MIKRILSLSTHTIYQLPVLILMPHSRCNCRCVMCDIWKANQTKKEISEEELQKHLNCFEKLGVKEIVFSGGEALMHTNLWNLCSMLKNMSIKLTLLSTGLLLDKYAPEVIKYFSSVIVSLDGSEHVHDHIRNVPSGFKKIKDGILALRRLNPNFRITARSVLQKRNYFDFVNTVKAAHELTLDQISFLAADISTEAFSHTSPLDEERKGQIALDAVETVHFRKIVEQSLVDLKHEYDLGFIAESPTKMLKLVQYYEALNTKANFPEVVCNAPWVSAVVESDGNVRPCFFHKPYGNIHTHDFEEIINSKEAVKFRKNLNVKTDPVCTKCVCTLKLGVLHNS